MFQGFSDATFEYFMAIQFNNNTEFFHSNHDWYMEAVRTPCLELAAALSETMMDIDDEIELRPDRVVSRINRDLRFSRDKSPYRDYMWLRLRRPAPASRKDSGAWSDRPSRDNPRANPGFYFDISARESSYGMGFYEESKSHMNGFRRRMLTEPDAILALLMPLQADFILHLNTFKRMRLPENLHPDLRAWYPVRSFWFVHDIGDFELLKSPALVDELNQGFQKLAPFYHYIHEIPSESDEDLTRILRGDTALK